MKLHFFKILFCFLIFPFSASGTSHSGASGHSLTFAEQEKRAANELIRKKELAANKAKQDKVNKCASQQDHLFKAKNIACSLYGKLDDKACSDAVDKCEKFKEIDSTDADASELAEDKEKMYKACPWKASVHRNLYIKNHKDTEKKLGDAEDKIDTLVEDIQKKEIKIKIALTNSAVNLTEIQKRSRKQAKIFLNEIKDLDKDTKSKIEAEMAKVAAGQKQSILVNTKTQQLAMARDEFYFNRENACHENALAALRKYKKAKARKILRGTHSISFSNLIKQSKLTRKQRDKKYKNAFYKNCLNNPRSQKKLEMLAKKGAMQGKALQQQQQEELVKMKQAQKAVNDIALKKHVDHGKLLAEQHETTQAFIKEIGIQKTVSKDKVAALRKDIKRLSVQLHKERVKREGLKGNEDIRKIYEEKAVSNDKVKQEDLKNYYSASQIFKEYDRFDEKCQIGPQEKRILRDVSNISSK